jgi:sporulation protein YtfJ
MENNEKKSPLADMMAVSMGKIHEMIDSNTVIGEAITTPDGVTLIPVSRLTFGFGSGGADYGSNGQKFGGGCSTGAKIDPIAFLVVKDGVTRVLPVAVPAVSTVDRVVEMVPEIMDRVENFVDKKKAKEEY